MVFHKALILRYLGVTPKGPLPSPLHPQLMLWVQGGNVATP